MSLDNILTLTSGVKKQGLSEERLKAQLPHLRSLIAQYREYPDLFIDEIKGENCSFEFFLLYDL